MQSAAITWILLNCYLLNSWNGMSLCQGASYPKPSVEVIPSNVIIKGGNFTIRCSASSTGVRFILYRGIRIAGTLDPRGNEAEFHFTNAQQRDSGTYTCRYNPTSDGKVYSDASDPIEIEVRETFPKPSLQVSPGNEAVRGGTLTFRCTGEPANMRFTLRYMRRTELQTVEPPGNEAVFTITDVQLQHEGSYDCYYQTKSAATVYSVPSDSIDIRVRDLPKASIFFEPVPGVKGDYKIWCLAPEAQNVHRFLLYKDGVEAPLADRNVQSGQHSVTFPVSDSNPQTCQKCRCSYQIMESGVALTSPLSDLVFLGRVSVTDHTCTVAEPDFTQRNIVQAVLIVAVLLILLIILVEHFYSIKNRKNEKSSEQEES